MYAADLSCRIPRTRRHFLLEPALGTGVSYPRRRRWMAGGLCHARQARPGSYSAKAAPRSPDWKLSGNVQGPLSVIQIGGHDCVTWLTADGYVEAYDLINLATTGVPPASDPFQGGGACLEAMPRLAYLPGAAGGRPHPVRLPFCQRGAQAALPGLRPRPGRPLLAQAGLTHRVVSPGHGRRRLCLFQQWHDRPAIAAAWRRRRTARYAYGSAVQWTGLAWDASNGKLAAAGNAASGGVLLSFNSSLPSARKRGALAGAAASAPVLEPGQGLMWSRSARPIRWPSGIGPAWRAR